MYDSSVSPQPDALFSARAQNEQKKRRASCRPYFWVWLVIIELSFGGSTDTSSAFGCSWRFAGNASNEQKNEERFAGFKKAKRAKSDSPSVFFGLGGYNRVKLQRQVHSRHELCVWLWRFAVNASTERRAICRILVLGGCNRVSLVMLQMSKKSEERFTVRIFWFGWL